MTAMTDEKRVSELLPCPFCGGKASVRHERDLYLDRYQRHFVKCGSCGASGSEKIANEDDAYGAIQSVLAGWNRRSQESDGWRPIETAPKDGTRILLASGSGLVFTGWWDADPDDHDNDGWVDDAEVWWEPHHWRPLPAAPIPQSNEAK